MATDILKSFLCDPKKAKRDLFPRCDEIFLNLYIYRNRLKLRELVALRLQRLDEAEVIKDRRMNL